MTKCHGAQWVNLFLNKNKNNNVLNRATDFVAIGNYDANFTAHMQCLIPACLTAISRDIPDSSLIPLKQSKGGLPSRLKHG